MLALNCLRVPLTRAMHVGVQMPAVCPVVRRNYDCREDGRSPSAHCLRKLHRFPGFLRGGLFPGIASSDRTGAYALSLGRSDRDMEAMPPAYGGQSDHLVVRGKACRRDTRSALRSFSAQCYT
jgi:hypothetical protein